MTLGEAHGPDEPAAPEPPAEDFDTLVAALEQEVVEYSAACW